MARAAPLRRRPMRGGHARRRGKPRLFLSAPLGSWVLFSEAAPRPRPASAPLRPPTPLPLFLSSSLPLFRAQSLSLFGLASRSLSSLFFFFVFVFLSFPAAASSPLLFLFVERARFLALPRKKKHGKGRKKMEEKAPGPALSKINCSPRGRSIRLKEAAGAGAFRALRKAKPPRRVGRPSPSLGGGAA